MIKWAFVRGLLVSVAVLSAGCGGSAGGGAQPGSTVTPFSFTQRTGVALNTSLTSNTITVLVSGTPQVITVTGGQYSINGVSNWTSGTGTVSNGQTVTLKQTTASANSTATQTVLTIGSQSSTFTTVTVAAGMVPVVSQGGLTWILDTQYAATSWQLANTTCTTTTINGLSGWTLPTLLQLASLRTSGAAVNQGWVLNGEWAQDTSASPGYHYYLPMASSSAPAVTSSDAGPVNFTCVHT